MKHVYDTYGTEKIIVNYMSTFITVTTCTQISVIQLCKFYVAVILPSF